MINRVPENNSKSTVFSGRLPENGPFSRDILSHGGGRTKAFGGDAVAVFGEGTLSFF
jgi:hypothetical protein